MGGILYRWVGLAAIAVLSGCAHLAPRMPEGPLARADRWEASARRDPDGARASGKSLAVLRLALADDSTRASGLADAALARFAARDFKDGKLHSNQFTGPDGISYRVRLSSQTGDWSPAQIDYLDPIRPARTRASSPLQWGGEGVPMIGVSRPDRRKEPFAPRRGYRLPVTVVADMQTCGDRCDATIRLLNPEVTKTVRLDGKSRPVAGDLYTPSVETFRSPNPLILGLRWLLLVDRFDYPTNLIFMQPYDPKRIPVVLVHGLLSTPIMWGEVVRGLEADPLIRENYQFWAFHYPTGQPIVVSALELRQSLREAEARYRLPRGLVLVGHSMGGIISRAQVSDSGGSAVFDHIFGADAPRVARRLPDAPLLRDTLFFDRDKNVRRVIFVCTPHRGSNMALAGPVGFFAALIRLPNNIAGTVSKVSDVVTTMDLRRPPTSICGLSPRSPFLEALDRRPIGAPHHTILGDRGRGDSPNSSDGVVPYSSAHLATAESELVVPDGHGAFRHPAAIAEMRRILREHLAQSGR